MTDVQAKSTVRFDIPVAELAKVKGQVTVIPPKLDVVAELHTYRALVGGLVEDYRRITHGRVTFSSGPMQAPYAWCKKIGLTGLKTVLFAPLGFFAGGVVGSVFVNTSMALASGVFAAGTIAGVVAPVFAGVAVALSRFDNKRREGRYVQLEGPLAGVLERFHAASGAERTLLGSTIDTWLHDLDTRKALSPEARVALVEAQEAHEDVGYLELRRVENLKLLNAFMEENTPVNTAHVAELGAILNAFTAEEQARLAPVVINHVRNSGRKIEYQANHDLYALLQARSSLLAASPADSEAL